MKKFTKDHEWIVVDGDVGTVGITDFAQQQLGDIVSIELPKPGTAYKQKDSFAVVDSMKSSSEVYCPVSGTVAETNEKLSAHPELINSSPEKDAWIAKFKITDNKELESLMDESAYKEYCKTQAH